MSQCVEGILEIPYKKMTYLRWHQGAKIPVIALHGWLDNAASFAHLAPLLPDCDIVALDLPGHGHSDHQPHGAHIHLIDYVITVIQVLHQLKWSRCILLGHSLGAGIATVVAGTVPEAISGVGLIDGLGPFTTPPEAAPKQLYRFMQDLLAKPYKNPSMYDTLDQAVDARLRANQMKRESAKAIVARGTKSLEDGRLTWRTDPKLLFPPALQLSEEQLLAFIKAIEAPVRLVRPKEGFPFDAKIMQHRYESLANAEMTTIEGHHHVHLDTPEPVAEFLRPFFESAIT